MQIENAEQIVRSWVDAWNSHDIEGVLAHFHENASFTSPFARMALPDTDGVFHGKEEIRRYWSRALDLIPDLRFEVERYFVGVGALVIQYRNHRGLTVDEVLIFDGDKVSQGFGTYPPGSVPVAADDRPGAPSR